MEDLFSTTTRVETPFIIATIGDYTFGAYSKETRNIIWSNKEYYSSITTIYPNFMQSLTVDKINGNVNTYTLVMKYAIRPGDDPNLLEKIFSSVSKSRNIKLSYGDLSTPSYIYKEEEALITQIRSSIDMQGSSITYTLNCVSKAMNLNSGTFSFPKTYDKPSNIIKEILYNKKYLSCGALDIFYGMRDKAKVLLKGLIAGNDKTVEIEAKKQISVFNYIKYLVECMSDISDSDTELQKRNKYVLVVYDDLTGEFGGPYFKISKMTSNIKDINSLDTYTIDVGYPNPQNIVTSISFDDNQTYSILYDYSKENNQSQYIYRINNEGQYQQVFSPSISNSAALMKTTEADRDWWSTVTQYPISVTLTMKGLLKPAILMTYVKLNIWFYGQKYIGTGTYIVTKQTDQISTGGFTTTLKLTRIGGLNDN